MRELVNIVNGITDKYIDNMESFNDKFCTIWNITKHAKPSLNLKVKTLNHFKRYNNMNDIKYKTWGIIDIGRGIAK